MCACVPHTACRAHRLTPTTCGRVFATHYAVRALSQLLSTAALDKSPESQARGITMDLGFSAFMTAVPPRLAGASLRMAAAAAPASLVMGWRWRC